MFRSYHDISRIRREQKEKEKCAILTYTVLLPVSFFTDLWINKERT